MITYITFIKVFLWYWSLCCKVYECLILWMKSVIVDVQMKATEQYFPDCFRVSKTFLDLGLRVLVSSIFH